MGSGLLGWGKGVTGMFPEPLRRTHDAVMQAILGPFTEEELHALRQTLQQLGLEEAAIETLIQDFQSGRFREGQSFGGLHIEDISQIVEWLLIQGASKVTLTIELESLDDDHLTLSIERIGKAW